MSPGHETSRSIVERTRACRRALALTLVALVGACDKTPSPPAVDAPEAPLPFPPSTHRGIDGDYTLTGGHWSIDRTAYSYRYHHAFDRLSVLVTDPRVRADAVRITQPEGHGAPLPAFANVFAAVELEIYDRPPGDRTTYERAADQNLASGADLRADSEHPAHPLASLTDGQITAEVDGTLFMSKPTGGAHWIEARFDTPTFFNQIVLYWPFHKQQGPWHRDVGVVDGLRAQKLVVQVLENGLWRTLPIVEVRPGSLHDGAFLESWIGLPFRPTSRLDHLVQLERWRTELPRDAAAVPGANDVRIDASWSITVLEESPELVDIAARELSATLAVWNGERPRVGTHAGTEDRTITLGLLDGAPPGFADAWASAGGGDLDAVASGIESYAVLVTTDRIYALGRDARGARYAACRLTERMESRAASILSLGAETRRPAYVPRGACPISIGEGGPDGLGVSDTYLSLMAHYYLDALYIFQATPYLDVTSVVGSGLDPQLTPDPAKLGQLRGLIARAKRQGIDVFWCVTIPGVIPPAVMARHPEIRTEHPEPLVVCLSTRAGRAFVEDAAERIASALPDLEGIVVLRTEMSYGCGGRALCDRCRRETTPANDPAQAIFGWIADAVAAADADMKVIAFDWRGGGVPPVDVEALPENVGYWFRPDRVVSGSLENDIRDVVPDPSLHETVARLGGRHLYLEGQLSHPFPFHTSPEVPLADLYWDGFVRRLDTTRTLRTLRSRAHAAPPVGFVSGNGSGFYPTPMQDLALRVLAWEPLEDREDALARVAGRWFGEAAAHDVRDTWRRASHAVREHAHFEKYLTRLTRIRAPGASSGELTEELAGSTALLVREVEEAMEGLRRAVNVAPASHVRRARRALSLAEGLATSLVSLDSAAQWAARYPGVTSETLSRIPVDERARAATILHRELDNTHRTIALFGQHAIFRAHPYYRNWFGLPVIASKAHELAAMIHELEGTGGPATGER